MNLDFSTLNFETIDANINSYPDMYINQNGITFTKKVLEDLGYPAYVLCLLDAKAKVFAIRMCKSNEPKGLLCLGQKNPHKNIINVQVCRRWRNDLTSNENHRIVREAFPRR